MPMMENEFSKSDTILSQLGVVILHRFYCNIEHDASLQKTQSPVLLPAHINNTLTTHSPGTRHVYL